MTLISVLMPFRDAAGTIEEAASSILAQRDVALELVAVDDASRDDGAARLASLACGDRRIVLVSGDGRGIADSLGRGLAAARGDLVARMDADDVALPGRLAKQAALIQSDSRLGAVGTRVEPLGPCGEGMRRYIAWQNGLVGPGEHRRDLFVESPLCHPSVLVRRTALEDVGGWQDVPWAEDYDLWLRLDARGWLLAKVPEVLLLWRQRQGSATVSDPRYTRARFVDARAAYLAPRLLRAGRPIAVWGAGPTGRRLARALERFGVRASRFVDIDPQKIGRVARSAPIAPPESLRVGEHTIVVAVGARGARGLVRAHLDRMGFVEGDDFVCAA
jgi:glycosyltransferase involved in cell wall biosynthesis